MAKSKAVFVCTDCGWSAPKWQGQCRNCGAWDTLEEFHPGPDLAVGNTGKAGAPPQGLVGSGAGTTLVGSGAVGPAIGGELAAADSDVKTGLTGQDVADGIGLGARRSGAGSFQGSFWRPNTGDLGLTDGALAQPIEDVSARLAAARPTGIGEFDRVLGGGLVPGAVVLLAGEPGVGKSTLLLEVAAAVAQKTLEQETSGLASGFVRGAGGGAAGETSVGNPGGQLAALPSVKQTTSGQQTINEATDQAGPPHLQLVTGGAQTSGAKDNEFGTDGAEVGVAQTTGTKTAGSRTGGRVLYITGEESAAQVKLRAERIGAICPELFLASESSIDRIGAQVQKLDPQLLIVDSVQTMVDPAATGSAGGVTQVRAVAAGLIRLAKARHLPVLLVGHVTKDGNLAGPRMLEHLVDVVCQFEGEATGRLRLLRAIKNRYGPTDEVGCFDLTDRGLESLADPSGLFLSHSPLQQPGACVSVSLEGRRPLPTEIQALVAPGAGGSARRTTVGLEHSRVAMILAVLHARLGMDLGSLDVYASTVGGAKILEPATDLAVALAVASAYLGRALDRQLVAVGEVLLTGEIRPCVGLERRLSEAARLGFRQALIPAAGSSEILPRITPELEIVPVLHLADALATALPDQQRTAEAGSVSPPKPSPGEN